MFHLTMSPLREEFQIRQDVVYFNHAGVSPIPARTAHRITELAQRMATLGSYHYFEMERFQETARQRGADLLQVAREQMAFVPNTSTGLSSVAIGLDWRPGDEIITTDQEFPSNLLVWLDVARRFGVRLHQVPSQGDGHVAAEALLARLTPATRVVTVSAVQYATGAAVDLALLGEALRHRATLLVVDAIQSLGVLPLPASQWGVDVVVADGHKWLLGPEGAGLMYLSPKAMEQIAPRLLGWHSVANAGDYSHPTTEPRAGARRFEPGSPNLLGEAALGESIGLLQEAGMDVVQDRIGQLMDLLIASLRARGCGIETPLTPQERPAAGILVFSHPRQDATRLHAELMNRGVLCAARGRGIRLAPHFYQDGQDVERFLAILDAL